MTSSRFFHDFFRPSGLFSEWRNPRCLQSGPEASSITTPSPFLDSCFSSHATDRERLLFSSMDRLTIFGLFAVTAMLVSYAREGRSHWFILAFAGSCVLASAYGFLQGAWPFGLVEAVWSVIAAHRWWLERRSK
jgi:uncharacterized membrane protein